MTGTLAKILSSKRAEIAALRDAPRAPGRPRETRDVPAALRTPRALSLVAEVKFRSPSGGALSRALDAGARALAYAEAGAAMVSVLCDGPFFDGSYDDVTRARAALDAGGFGSVPLLAKEFVLDAAQIDRARAAGADAVLLIARIAPGDALMTLAAACRAADLEPFVEVVDDAELSRALAAGARVVGVNARDLDTLVVDVDRAARVVARVPPDRVAVLLSGLRDPEAVARAASTRADAALVGESLMREDDPRVLLKRMLAHAPK